MGEGPASGGVLERTNMVSAWEKVRANKGAPGVDEVTVKRWERNWEENLDRLIHMARTNTYHPNRPRRFRVLKKDGGWRELSILTVSDRVLQRAALNVLMPVFESRFLDGSFGYRPERNVAQAVERLLQARDAGYRWLLDADIDSCFDNLDHSLILEGLREAVSNYLLLRLFELWLGVGRRPSPPAPLPQGEGEGATLFETNPTPAPLPQGEGGKVKRKSGRGRKATVGVPLGAVISPLLCNVVLHRLDLALDKAGWPWVRYADDFVVLTRSEAEALAAWDMVEAALSEIRLALEPSKTWVTSFERGFKFLGVVFEGDRYWYVREGQRREGRGQEVDVLWEWPPEGYEWEW